MTVFRVRFFQSGTCSECCERTGEVFFSTREGAEEFAAEMSERTGPEVEEVEVTVR